MKFQSAILQLSILQKEQTVRKTKCHFLIVCIIAIPAVVMQGRIGAKPASDSWFSITSVVHHNEALNGAHDVELSGNLAFVPGKGGSDGILMNFRIRKLSYR